MLFSGGLAKLAIMRREEVPEQFVDVTDGRIAILFLARRPRDLDDIQISDWDEVDWAVEPAPYLVLPRKND
jgi:hypothetical protein